MGFFKSSISDKLSVMKNAYVYFTLLQNQALLSHIKLTPEQQQQAEKLLQERKEKYLPISKYKSFTFYNPI